MKACVVEACSAVLISFNNILSPFLAKFNDSFRLLTLLSSRLSHGKKARQQTFFVNEIKFGPKTDFIVILF